MHKISCLLPQFGLIIYTWIHSECEALLIVLKMILFRGFHGSARLATDGVNSPLQYAAEK